MLLAVQHKCPAALASSCKPCCLALPVSSHGFLLCTHAACKWCWPGHLPQKAVLLQIEDCDQTTVTALSEWDDGRTLEGYSFTTDDYAAPSGPDGMRKLAYRSGTVLCSCVERPAPEAAHVKALLHPS